jgi:hypothetical protein
MSEEQTLGAATLPFVDKPHQVNDGSGLIPLKKSFWKVAGRGSQE